MHYFVPSLCLVGSLSNVVKGEVEHRRVKRFYARTNKGRTFERQIARHQRRERLLRNIAKRAEKAKETGQDRPSTHPAVPLHESDPLPPTLPEQHTHISNTKRLRLNLFQWLDDNENDAALEVPMLSFTF